LIKSFIKIKSINQEDIFQLFDSHDRDQDNLLSYQEFFDIFAPFNKEYRTNLLRKEGIKGAEGPMGDGTRGFDGVSSGKERKFNTYKGFNQYKKHKDSSAERFYDRPNSPKRPKNSASISGKGTWGVNKTRQEEFLRGGKGVDFFKEYTVQTRKSLKELMKLLLATIKNYDYSKAIIQDKLMELFTMLDRDIKGRIKCEDIGDALAERGIVTKNRELQALIRQFDLDRDGKITFDEMVREFSPKRSQSPRRRS
jgi:Ca2+-binding EF-hand superfamily protein